MQRSDFRHFYEMPVRWGDLDAFGHVNNVQFIRFLESGRVAYVEDVLGMPVGVGTGENIILADLQCAFRSQLEYPGVVEVATRVSRLGSSSFDLTAAIYRRGEAQAAATSKGVLVWFDFDAQRARPIPEHVRRAIIAYEPVAPL